VRSVNLTCGWQTPPKGSLSFEVRLDGPEGKSLGAGVMPAVTNKGQMFGIAHIPVGAVTDGNLHSIYFLYKGKEPVAGGVMSLQFNAK